ncbi:MAG: sugar phosphate isomerase/epimerase, partial [Planctomycetes bacterium]|nr:sugar phosphate isomerase/epimerase [Planctomycetota bacterium]
MTIKKNELTRRHMLAATTAAVAAGYVGRAAPARLLAADSPEPKPKFIYCLNTSTIRGQKRGIVKEAQIASQAGYSAIEPWMRSISDYQNAGGSL